VDTPASSPQVRQAAEALQMGKANEVSIRTEKLVAVARPLTPDYFVVLALAPKETSAAPGTSCVWPGPSSPRSYSARLR